MTAITKKSVKKWASRVFACLLVIATWLLWYVPDSRMLAVMPSGGTVIRKEVFKSIHDGIETAQILYYKDDYETVNKLIHEILNKRGFKARNNGVTSDFDVLPIGTLYSPREGGIRVDVMKGSYDANFTYNRLDALGLRNDGKGTTVFLVDNRDNLVNVVQCFLRGTL